MKRASETFFFLTIFLLPTYLIRFTVFSVPLNALDILEIVSIVSSFIFLFLYCHQGRRVREEQRNLLLFRIQEKKWAIVGFLLIVLGSLVSAYSSDGFRAQELGVLKSWVILPFLFVFLGYLCEFSFRRALMWHVGSAVIVSLIAFVLPTATAFTYDGRLRGWYESPNQLAMYIAPALVLLWFLWRKKRKMLNGYLVGLLIIAGALVFTQSLGAILSVAIAIFVGEMVMLEKRGIFFRFCHCESAKQSRHTYFGKLRLLRGLAMTEVVRMGVIIFGIFFFTVSALFFIQKEFFEIKFFSDRSSLSSRTMIWTSALHIARDNPILGIGPGNFQEKYLEYQQFYPPYLEWAVPHPHNIFLTFWLYSGVLGVIGFFLVVGKVFFKKSRHCENKGGCHCESAKQSQLTKISVSGLLRGLAMTIFSLSSRAKCHSDGAQSRDLPLAVVSEIISEKQNKKTADIFAIAVFCALLSILLHGLVDTTIWGNALGVVFWLTVINVRNHL